MAKRIAKPLRTDKQPEIEPYVTNEIVDGQKYDLTYWEPMHPFPMEQVTGIQIIAFNDEGKILAIRKRKKFDPARKLNIIVGTHEGDDKNYEETTRREAREEANVVLGQLLIAAVIERKLAGTSSQQASYHLVMTARVKDFTPYVEYQEPNERFFLAKDDFLKRYNAGRPEDIAKLIDMAEFVINESPQYDDYIRHILERS